MIVVLVVVATRCVSICHLNGGACSLRGTLESLLSLSFGSQPNRSLFFT